MARAGFSRRSADEPAYTEDDVRALRLAAEGLMQLIDQERERAVEAVVRETRTVSSYLSQRVRELPVRLANPLRAQEAAG